MVYGLPPVPPYRYVLQSGVPPVTPVREPSPPGRDSTSRESTREGTHCESSMKESASRTSGYSHYFYKPFLRHAQRLMRRRVEVGTTSGKLVGELRGVFSDHLLLVVDGREWHIRLEQIVYLTPAH
ncbi:MAG TPA: DUF2642 domain-containing protein [Calditerricola sp.]